MISGYNLELEALVTLFVIVGVVIHHISIRQLQVVEIHMLRFVKQRTCMPGSLVHLNEDTMRDFKDGDILRALWVVSHLTPRGSRDSHKPPVDRAEGSEALRALLMEGDAMEEEAPLREAHDVKPGCALVQDQISIFLVKPLSILGWTYHLSKRAETLCCQLHSLQLDHSSR